MSLWDLLIHADKVGLLIINSHHNAFLDAVMRGASNMLVWFPLYALFLFLLWKRWGKRAFFWSLPLLAVMIWCTDSGSVLLFKETVHRLRPCQAPNVRDYVRAVDGCGGLYGFVSSHASNHFGIAAFMIGILQGTPRWTMWALLGWAALIGYSRIYLGLHYPADIFIGGLYGAAIGWIFFLIFRWIADRANKA
jgi:undecaprenyl-diphosphatase